MVVLASPRFAIASEVDSDEPSALASRHDLTNLARHTGSSFLRNQVQVQHIANRMWLPEDHLSAMTRPRAGCTRVLYLRVAEVADRKQIQPSRILRISRLLA